MEPKPTVACLVCGCAVRLMHFRGRGPACGSVSLGGVTVRLQRSQDVSAMCDQCFAFCLSSPLAQAFVYETGVRWIGMSRVSFGLVARYVGVPALHLKKLLVRSRQNEQRLQRRKRNAHDVAVEKGRVELARIWHEKNPWGRYVIGTVPYMLGMFAWMGRAA